MYKHHGKVILRYGIYLWKLRTDIIEMALIAEESGNTFHSYIRIHYSIPKRMKELRNITDKTLAAIGCGFNDSMTALMEECDRSNFHRTRWLVT